MKKQLIAIALMACSTNLLAEEFYKSSISLDEKTNLTTKSEIEQPRITPPKEDVDPQKNSLSDLSPKEKANLFAGTITGKPGQYRVTKTFDAWGREKNAFKIENADNPKDFIYILVLGDDIIPINGVNFSQALAAKFTAQSSRSDATD